MLGKNNPLRGVFLVDVTGAIISYQDTMVK